MNTLPPLDGSMVLKPFMERRRFQKGSEGIMEPGILRVFGGTVPSIGGQKQEERFQGAGDGGGDRGMKATSGDLRGRGGYDVPMEGLDHKAQDII